MCDGSARLQRNIRVCSSSGQRKCSSIDKFNPLRLRHKHDRSPSNRDGNCIMQVHRAQDSVEPKRTAGPRGPAGPIGAQGPSGPQGPTGPQGPDGVAVGYWAWGFASNMTITPSLVAQTAPVEAGTYFLASSELLAMAPGDTVFCYTTS